MNTAQLNDTDKAIYNHIRRDNHYYIPHDTSNFYQDIKEEYFPIPCTQSLFELGIYVGKTIHEQKSFVQYLKHLDHYGCNVEGMTHTDHNRTYCQSFSDHTINFLDLAILTMNRPLIEYCKKNMMLPHFEEKTIHDLTHPLISILEYGEFDLLPLYEKQGLHQLPNTFYHLYGEDRAKYSETSLLHYVAGDVSRVISDPEVRQRSIERLNYLKENYGYLLSGEICEYDQAYLKKAQHFFEESISHLSKQEQKSIKEFFDAIDNFFDLPTMSYDEAKQNTVKKKKVHI